jgi:glutamate synthase domain-containing protein 2
VRDDFMKAVAYLRSIGHKRITLKTGSYGMEALALAIRCATDAGLDLLTIDGSGGGTGMSPWNMMENWGVPSLPLHAKAYEYTKLLADRGLKVPDLSFAGGFAREDHVFKALALGAPFVKLVCMGRAPMIPAFVGSNIEGVLRGDERRAQVHGHWDELPASVAGFGDKPEQIFSAWEEVMGKVGAEEMKKIPFGAVAMYSYADKLGCGLQQFMAGARKASISKLTRSDLMSANRETEAETGIPFMMDAGERQGHGHPQELRARSVLSNPAVGPRPICGIFVSHKGRTEAGRQRMINMLPITLLLFMNYYASWHAACNNQESAESR